MRSVDAEQELENNQLEGVHDAVVQPLIDKQFPDGVKCRPMALWKEQQHQR